MSGGYVELHAKSFYSFGLGASHFHELLAQAMESSYDCLALTDTNLCGALDFARQANALGLRPVTGGELTLACGSRLTLLARTREGYGNLSRLFTLANAADRRNPCLDPGHLPQHAAGLTLLTGGRDGPLSALMAEGRRAEGLRLLRHWLDCFGGDAVYVELQRNFLEGDARRNQELAALARDAGVSVIATNDVHYHAPERCRLQHALVAASHNTTIDQALRYIRPNHHLCLKPPADMDRLFRHCPEAVANARRVAETCRFDLSADLGYKLPDADVPQGYTSGSYLQQLCYEAAVRRYGWCPARWQSGCGRSSGLSSGTTWLDSCCSTTRLFCWPSRSWRRRDWRTRKRRWNSGLRAGGAAPPSPCWWATSPASATWTPSVGA